MEYHTFKTLLAEMVAERLGHDSRIMIQQIPKNNGICRESMTILQEEGMAVPAICLESYFRAYQRGEAITVLAETIIEEIEKNKTQVDHEMDFFQSYEKAMPGICCRIINYGKNKELLKLVPHRRIMDLAMIYYYRLENFGDQSASILIYNEHVEHWGITEEELYRHARRNTCRLLPPQMAGILQVIDEISEDAELLDLNLEDCEDDMMFVLTNQEKYYGAVCFLYPELAAHIAELFSRNFYILPSSIHECIIMPDYRLLNPQELKELVHDVNRQCVDEEDILSDNVYYYDRIQKKFFLMCGYTWPRS